MRSQFLLSIASLNSDPTTYVPVNHPCRLVKATSVVTTAVTTNTVTVTIGDGTTTAGTLTIAAGAAGTVDNWDWDADVGYDRDTPMKIVCSGTPGAGAINITFEFSEAHAD